MSIAKWSIHLARLLSFLPLLQLVGYWLLRDRFPFEAGSWGRQLVILLYAYLPMSAGTALLLGIDKWLAVSNSKQSQQHSRIPEGQLHLLEWLGGWPGSWMAQRGFRHKTAKSLYQWQFWPIVVAHMTGLAWLMAAGLLGLIFSLACWLLVGACIIISVILAKFQRRQRGIARAEARRVARGND